MIGSRLGIYSSQGGAGSILDYSPLHWWDTDNVSVVSTTTTVTDIGTVGGLNMVNPTASNQPTLNSADASFNGYDSLTFDGVSDYISNSVSDFRGSDSSGVIISVFKINSGSFIFDLTSADSSAGSPYINSTLLALNTYRVIHNAGSLRSFNGSTNIFTGSPSVVIAQACTGSVYKLWRDSSVETLTITGGSNDGGVWFDGAATEDSISIGSRLTSTPLYSNITWVASGYFAYIDDTTIVNIQNFLKTKYGI